MSIRHHVLAPIALGVAVLGATAPAQALTADPLAFTIFTAGDVLITPELVFTVAAAGPKTWKTLIELGVPFMVPYAETTRQLALNKAPTLKPVSTPANPPAVTYPTAYSQTISFGDSMSDTGNMFEVTRKLGGIGLPTAPNDRGRFSDGQVVVEAMSNALNLPLLNYAFGGAQSGKGSLLPFYAMEHGLLKQINDYLGNLGGITKRADANALYVIWTGPDDFYWGNNIYLKSTAVTVTANVKQGMTSLYKRGARHFFVPLMPDLSITPSARQHVKLQRTYMADAKNRSIEYANALTAMLKAFAKQYPDAKVRTFDTYTYSQQRVAQAADEGYNVTDACYTPKFMGLPGDVCADPKQYLFWDTNHPTEAGSIVIGTAFAEAVVGPALPSR